MHYASTRYKRRCNAADSLMLPSNDSHHWFIFLYSRSFQSIVWHRHTQRRQYLLAWQSVTSFSHFILWNLLCYVSWFIEKYIVTIHSRNSSRCRGDQLFIAQTIDLFIQYFVVRWGIMQLCLAAHLNWILRRFSSPVFTILFNC